MVAVVHVEHSCDEIMIVDCSFNWQYIVMWPWTECIVLCSLLWEQSVQQVIVVAYNLCKESVVGSRADFIKSLRIRGTIPLSCRSPKKRIKPFSVVCCRISPPSRRRITQLGYYNCLEHHMDCSQACRAHIPVRIQSARISPVIFQYVL